MSANSSSRLDTLSWVIIGLTLGFIVLVYGRLPEQIPIHWNAQGEIDDYASKPVGAFLAPIVALATVFLMKLVPKISPKGFELDSSKDAMSVIQFVLVAMFCVVGVVTVLIAMGYELDMPKIIFVATGLVFVGTGNVLSKVRKNFFVGIRTPWTLADDEVWSQTHRFAARSFFVGGLLICLVPFFTANVVLPTAVMGVVVLAPVVYSYILYRKLNSTEGN